MKRNFENVNSYRVSENAWKKHRRLVSPLINLPSLRAYLPIFNHHIRSTVANLPVTDEFVDLLPYVLNCKHTMFTEAALGSKMEPSEKQKYIQRFTQ